jgi:hypothetical protein
MGHTVFLTLVFLPPAEASFFSVLLRRYVSRSTVGDAPKSWRLGSGEGRIIRISRSRSDMRTQERLYYRAMSSRRAVWHESYRLKPKKHKRTTRHPLQDSTCTVTTWHRTQELSSSLGAFSWARPRAHNRQSNRHSDT